MALPQCQLITASLSAIQVGSRRTVGARAARLSATRTSFNCTIPSMPSLQRRWSVSLGCSAVERPAPSEYRIGMFGFGW
jgi:hypothetical protein